MSQKPAYRSWFRSIRDHQETYALDEIVYTARDGSLLEVVHDMDELRKTPADDWKRIFRERAHSSEWPYGSGVWGKKEWVLPGIENENVVSMYEGNTNLFWAERYGRELGLDELWIKQCGNSHTGSFKDLGMTVLVSMVKELIHRGKNVPAVACASTGDTSAALAAFAAAAAIPAIVFLPRGKVSVAQLMPRIQIGWPLSEGTSSSLANTQTTAPSACWAMSSLPRGAATGSAPSTSSSSSLQPRAARGLESALKRFLTTTWAHCSTVLPVS